MCACVRVQARACVARAGGGAEGKVLSPWVSHSAPPQPLRGRPAVPWGCPSPKLGGGLPEIRDLWQLSAAPATAQHLPGSLPPCSLNPWQKGRAIGVTARERPGICTAQGTALLLFAAFSPISQVGNLRQREMMRSGPEKLDLSLNTDGPASSQADLQHPSLT